MSGDDDPATAGQAKDWEVRAFAMRLLGIREYSVWELRQRIRRKWSNHAMVDVVVDTLAQEGLVSDERFAEQLVRSRKHKQQGPLKVRAALAGKGLGSAEIQAALDASADDWVDIASQWLARQQPDDFSYHGRAGLYRRLTSRGFSHEQALAAIERCRRDSATD